MQRSEQSRASVGSKERKAVLQFLLSVPQAVVRRLRQLYAAVSARIAPEEHALVGQVLDAGELRLFERMPRFDQRHCLDVYWTLLRAGYWDGLLLRAALIHDCGKVADDGRTIPLL